MMTEPRRVKDFIAPGSRVLIIGEFPSRDDYLSGYPFTGVAGQELSRMLHEAGILRSECSLTFVADTIPPKGDITHFFSKRTKSTTLPSAQLAADKERIHGLIARLQPLLIIPLGELALWATLGLSGTGKWRGSMLTLNGSIGVIPTYSPSAVLREWSWRYITVEDLRRCAAVIREGRLPSPPEYEFLLRPSFEQAVTCLEELLAKCEHARTRIAADIETKAGHISCLGLAWSATQAICIPFMSEEKTEGYWEAQEEIDLIQHVKLLAAHPNAEWVFQNGLYDLQYFARHWGFVPQVTMDTMLAHHVCFAGLPKSLDFLSSLYCEHHIYWKEDRPRYEKEGA